MILRLAALASIFLLSACAAPAGGGNSTQVVYDKLVGRYPAMRIADDKSPLDVRRIDGVTYASHASGDLKLDLVLPAATGAPLVVFVHGGGWRSGSREEFAPVAVRLARRGYASALVSYRLSTVARYPAAVHDVKAAVTWLRTHAQRYGLDPHRIALAGGSAGGQLASLAGMTAGVQAIVNVDGLSDFTSPEALRHEDDPAKNPSAAGQWFGGRYAEKAALWHEASPINNVSKTTPPILFIGSSEKRFSVGRSAMVDKLGALGVPSRVVELPDSPHSFWRFEPWVAPTVDAISVFLDTHLAKRSGP